MSVGNKEPFFKRHRNTVAVATGTTSAYQISDNDEERFGRFNYINIFNTAGEDILIKFDGSDTKSIRVNSGQALEQIGTLTFANYQIENLSAGEVAINEVEVTISNRIPQNEVITDSKLVIGQGSRIYNGGILI